jgi:hypothetical protein
LDVAPSKTSTTLPGSAVPDTVTLPVLLTLPSAGLVMTGAAGAIVSTVHVRVAGVGSVLPAESVARTAKVWEPSPRPVYVRGDVHAVNAAPSRLHSNVAAGSSAEKLNVAVVNAVEPSGPEPIVVFGATVSTTTVRAFEAADVLPAASVAFAVYVCEPSATPLNVLLQLPTRFAADPPFDVAPSNTSTKLPTSASPPSVTVLLPIELPSGGLTMTGGAGAVTSIVQVRPAGVASVLPAGSVARTSKVWLPSASPL